MKITFVVPTFDVSGGARVIETYARLLQARGHTVEIVGPELDYLSWRDRLRYWLGRRSGPVKPISPSHYDNSPVKISVARGKTVVGADDVPDADVVIATWWETAQWMDTYPSSKGRKFHFIQHYETFAASDPRDVDAVWNLPIRKIVISDWLERLARERFGISDSIKIYNSVDTQQFFAPPRDLQPVPTVGMLYHSARWKGTQEGIAAIRKLRETIPTARLLTFAFHEAGSDLAELGGAEHIVLPPQDEIRNIYSRCDVWLCSSFGEGFHLPPLEAMACRCPVVSTRVGGPEDIVVDGVNGYLVDVGDVAGLSAGLVNVLSGGRERWQSMSQAALDVALGYTWDDATDRFEKAISA